MYVKVKDIIIEGAGVVVAPGSSGGSWEQWWLMGSSGGSWEQWWLIGSSGGSLVATPDCKTAVLGSNLAISPAYSGLPVLRWAAICDGTSL